MFQWLMLDIFGRWEGASFACYSIYTLKICFSNSFHVAECLVIRMGPDAFWVARPWADTAVEPMSLGSTGWDGWGEKPIGWELS